MIKPKFAEKLIEEVENYEKWSHEADIHIQRPNSMNNYGAILDHFGFENVLQKLTTDFIQPFF